MGKINGTMIQYFEWYMNCDKGLWNDLKNNVSKLSDLGITSVWMPPACKGIGGRNDVRIWNL